MKPKDKPHYVNNKQFSLAVVDYISSLEKAKRECTQIPVIPDYIAESFLKIAEGLSHKSNFIRYTYREEMVMDAVENCLKAITNYNIDAATRTGAPNAFAYFTQICYYAFIRRISKEKKQQDIKFKFIERSGVENFLLNEEDDSIDIERTFFDELRERIDKVKESDQQLKDFLKTEKAKEKTSKKLELFMG